MQILTAATLSDVLDQLKTAEEQLASLEARLSLQKKFLDGLTEVILVELSEVDIQQDNKLYKLEKHVSLFVERRTITDYLRTRS